MQSFLHVPFWGVRAHTYNSANERVALARAQGLLELAQKYPIIDVRGRGLMCAVEFGGPDGGMVAPAGIAAATTKAAGKRNMLLLTAGARMPPLAHAVVYMLNTGCDVPFLKIQCSG